MDRLTLMTSRCLIIMVLLMMIISLIFFGIYVLSALERCPTAGKASEDIVNFAYA